MGPFFFSAKLDGERTLFLAPLTERRRHLATTTVDDSDGYFLFEKLGAAEDAAIEIIARVGTDDAALRLKEILNLD